MRRLLILALATITWLSAVHLVFRTDRRALIDPLTEHLRTADRNALRRSNPEWDLMARTFTVMAFLEQSKQRPELLGDVDVILAETLLMDAAAPDAFVLPYFHASPFADRNTKSLFVDGELALMLAARQLAGPAPQWHEPMRVRIDRLTAAMERGPVTSAESYPDEAWTFCNTVALAATTLSDRVDGRDHSTLRRRWVETAKRSLVDPKTGLLISSYTWDGHVKDGPEGSTLYLAAHMLQLVDPAFAAEQYARTRRELGGSLWGFAWSAEWPAAWKGPDDIDSGPTIPLLEANAGASGLALLGAAAFHDDDFLEGLVTSLRLGAFPITDGHRVRFAAGNTLADAVLLYALVLDARDTSSTTEPQS